MVRERRSRHARIADSDFVLIDRVKDKLYEKHPNSAKISDGEAITYSLKFTLGIETEENGNGDMVNIF